MNRITLLAAVVLAALAAALPALADQGGSVKGVLTALSASSVSVKSGQRTVTCAVRPASPSLADYAVGDRVQAQCRGARSHLVLARIRHLVASAVKSAVNDAEPVKFGGTITALSSDSISLHDGDRNLTCTIGDASPSTSTLTVGDHARVVCQNGVLVSLATVPTGGQKPPHPEPPSPAVTTAGGTVTAVSATSLTIHNVEHGDVTCSVSTDSPSLAEVHVGDSVKIACTSGVLSVLVRSTATPPPPPSAPAPSPATGTTFGGTLTALSSTSVTVHNDEHGDVTCSVTAASPHLGDFHLGDHVKLTCTDGVLTLIARS